MTHEAVPRRVYFLVFGTLLVLTGLTVGVTFFDLGQFNLVIALLIAGTKASLVVWFFMHVRQSSSLTKIFVVTGILFLAILLAFVFSDYGSRTWLATPSGW